MLARVSKKISSPLTGGHSHVLWQEIQSQAMLQYTAKRSQSPIVDGFTNMHDITSDITSNLVLSVEEDVASSWRLRHGILFSCDRNVKFM